MSKGGGGGGVQETESTVTQTNLPEYARPFYEEMLGRTVYESTRPYEAFPGQRLAEFNPFETTAMQGIAEMAGAGAPQQIRSASDIATQIGFQPSNLGMNIAQGFTPQAQFSGYTAGDVTSDYTAGDLAQGFTADQRTAGYQAGQFDPSYTAGDVQAQYTGQANFGPGFQAGTIADPATIQSYMNPYQQLVTDVQKREAKRASDTQAAEIGQQAAAAGGFGGYREGVLQAERERNLGQQLQDIQARGDQAAFAQAQQAFEADRAARLKQAQLGLQTGTAQQQALQQAEKFRQSAFQAGEGARQQAAKLGLTAQQQEEAARQAEEKFTQSQFAQNQQLQLAQQQEDRAAFQAGEAAAREAAQLGLSAQEISERTKQAENQARMAAREFNVGAAQDRARLGLAGLQADQATRGQALDAARLLGSLGGQEQAMAFDRLQNLQAAGEIQRQLGQRGLDIGYQDFLRQQAFPREQIGFFSSMLQGLPVAPGSSMAAFGVAPTTTQQLLGAGIGGVGLYKALGT